MTTHPPINAKVKKMWIYIYILPMHLHDLVINYEYLTLHELIIFLNSGQFGYTMIKTWKDLYMASEFKYILHK
jgi:hypothetical protein